MWLFDVFEDCTWRSRRTDLILSVRRSGHKILCFDDVLQASEGGAHINVCTTNHQCRHSRDWRHDMGFCSLFAHFPDDKCETSPVRWFLKTQRIVDHDPARGVQYIKLFACNPFNWRKVDFPTSVICQMRISFNKIVFARDLLSNLMLPFWGDNSKRQRQMDYHGLFIRQILLLSILMNHSYFNYVRSTEIMVPVLFVVEFIEWISYEDNLNTRESVNTSCVICQVCQMSFFII